MNGLSSTIDGSGRGYSRTAGLNRWAEEVGARAENMAEIDQAFNFTDPDYRSTW